MGRRSWEEALIRMRAGRGDGAKEKDAEEVAWKDATKNVEGHAPVGFRGPWMSGKKVSASGGPKQVNQRHAAQNGRYPILSISATQRPVSFMFSSFVGARGGQDRAFV